MKELKNYINLLLSGDIKTLARCISLVENEVEGYEEILENLPALKTPITGITGPPGAGKSSLTEGLIEKIVLQNKKVAVLCIDPSSPFNFGALLGDRIRMSKWYNHPDVYIRSLASRGSLGGLHPKIIEITELIKVAGFDHIIIETVGVGQSEVEIAGLADATVVVLVPEAGDEIQTMKSGIMEIADIFVVNKCDRPDADTFVKNLQMMLAPSFQQEEPVPIIKTNALTKEGIDDLFNAISEKIKHNSVNNKRDHLLAQRVFYLIQQKRMKNVDKEFLKRKIEEAGETFNLYKFIKTFD
jgi:LAO/AO transport system kinase